MLRTKVLAAALLALTSSACSTVGGWGDSFGLSPFWDWKQLETEHFRIFFPVELSSDAQKSSQHLEEAYSVLTRKLYWTPNYKTNILVIDNADAANGVTAPAGRFGIVLYLTPPDNWFSTNYYDDWLRLLVFHEYTHFVNMDTTGDFWQILRYIYGDGLLPNELWTTWMLEGLAVYMETRETHAGRGRSPFYEMVLRSAVDEGRLDTPSFITLDKINGPEPYYPGGESYYLFGYQLMNQISKTPFTTGRTDDERQPMADGEDALGIMSRRSGERFPYFINGNLENITGKSWFDYWDSFVSETKARCQKQIAEIKAQPVTKFEWLTPPDRDQSNQILGAAVSPDGKWIAYTRESNDEKMGLYLLEVATKKTRRLANKNLGAQVSFAPDSKTLFFSHVERYHQYYDFSDLAAFDLENDREYDLSSGLRARDPQVSWDGKSLTFTLTQAATTGLAMAPLELHDGKYKLGSISKVYWPEKYDRVTTPRFGKDDRSLIFTLHRNGQASEEIMQIDLESKEPKALVVNSHFNHYPVVRKDGTVFYVSDKTGVENLYQLKGDQEIQLTNLISGITYPTLGAKDVYASVFSTAGWNLARLDLSNSEGLDSANATIDPPPAPKPDRLSTSLAHFESAKIEPYSLWPTILPRTWAPLLALGDLNGFAGGLVAGADQLDFHRYSLSADYIFYIRALEYSVSYAFRQLGPTLSADMSDSVKAFSVDGSSQHQTNGSLSASYTFQSTYWSLTPALSFGFSRQFNYAPGANPANNDLVFQSAWIPNLTAQLSFRDLHSSSLAVTTEEGTLTTLGVRTYVNAGTPIPVGYLEDRHYFRITQHSALRPRVALSLVPTLDANPLLDTVVTGRTNQIFSFLGSAAGSAGFGLIPVRGYPGLALNTRAAALGSLDYTFPVFRIFRGIGTYPVFFDYIYGNVFGESAYLPYQEARVTFLPSAGGGIRFMWNLFEHIPFVAAVEYQQGFNTFAGGASDIFFRLGLGG